MIYQLSKTIIQLLRASTTILRELCLNRLSSNKSFFSLTQKRAGRSGCQPFYNSSLPSALSRLLTQTTEEIVDKLLFFIPITYRGNGPGEWGVSASAHTRGISRIQHNSCIFILFSPCRIFRTLKKHNCFSELNECTDQLMYFQGTELGR